jgi:TrmH family RNA methyltransferase
MGQKMQVVNMLSRDNQFVKYALKLKQKKYRDDEGRFIIEGIRLIEEGVREGLVEYILYSSKLMETNGAERIEKSGVKMYEVSHDILKELCDTQTPQGAAAVVIKPEGNLCGLQGDFIIIADGIQDPGNLGTIIRTADAAGADGVILMKGTVDAYNPKTLRSTMGSIFHIPVICYENTEELMDLLKGRGFSIYASSLENSQIIYNSDFKGKIAIVIGNEANGIPQEHMMLCTHKIKIPMAGRAESLNAASAAAIIIYEAVRQRKY